MNPFKIENMCKHCKSTVVTTTYAGVVPGMPNSSAVDMVTSSIKRYWCEFANEEIDYEEPCTLENYMNCKHRARKENCKVSGDNKK